MVSAAELRSVVDDIRDWVKAEIQAVDAETSEGPDGMLGWGGSSRQEADDLSRAIDRRLSDIEQREAWDA